MFVNGLQCAVVTGTLFIEKEDVTQFALVSLFIYVFFGTYTDESSFNYMHLHDSTTNATNFILQYVKWIVCKDSIKRSELQDTVFRYGICTCDHRAYYLYGMVTAN